MNFTLFFSIFSIVMTTAIGGLLIWLHFKLYEFKMAVKKMPMMEEKFTQSLMTARNNIQELEKFTKEKLPSLDGKLTEARQAIDEIDYMLSKTEKSMDHAENTLSQLSEKLKTASPTSAKIETASQTAHQPQIHEKQAPQQLLSTPQTQTRSESTTPPPTQDTSNENAQQNSMPSVQQQAYAKSASFSMRPQPAVNNDGTPSFVSESISRTEMQARNKQSSAEQSLRESLAEILK